MKKVISGIGILIALLALVYLGGVYFYSTRFVPQTIYGTVDISHMTLPEAQEHVKKTLNNEEITLTENGSVVETLQLADLDPEYRDATWLEDLYVGQNPTFWFESWIEQPIHAQDTVQVELALDDLVEQINSKDTNRKPAEDAYIDYNKSKGYFIEEGQEGTLIDEKRLEKAIAQALLNEDRSIDLSDAYEQPQITEDDAKIQQLMEEIDQMSHTEIELQLNEQEIDISEKDIQDWILFNANNQIVLDEEKVYEYLHQFNRDYGTFNKERRFESTMQGEVIVQPGILGWGIDVDATAPVVIDAIKEAKPLNFEPEIISTGGIAGAEDDIGDSYVEIDLTYQYLFLYHNGELITSTPIVSGMLGTETVPGANAVNQMLRDTDLVGVSERTGNPYEAPVEYWIRFDNDEQGIHDASWQWAYGDDVWTYAGSLGCINTPLDQVALVWEYVDYGTPVIVFR